MLSLVIASSLVKDNKSLIIFLLLLISLIASAIVSTSSLIVLFGCFNIRSNLDEIIDIGVLSSWEASCINLAWLFQAVSIGINAFLVKYTAK